MLDAPSGVSHSQSSNQTVNHQPASNDSSSQVQSTAPESHVSPGREREIDNWVQNNANAEYEVLGVGVDDDGGERVSKALNGDSSLGVLTPSEQRYLIDAASTEWRQTGNTENIREAAENLNDASTRQIVAEAYAAPSAENERHFAEGGTILSSPEAQSARYEMLKSAIGLDPAAVVRTYEGVEGALGRTAANMDGQLRHQLLETVASGSVDPTSDGVSKMVTAVFLKSESMDFLNPQYRETMSGALAQIMVDREGGTNVQQSVDTLAGRYDDILASPGGRSLLTNDKVVPELRGWAMAEIASNPSWDAQALRGGWDSEVVSSTYANSVVDRYQARGVEPQTLGDEALRNTIGQALGIAPDRLPGANETAEQAQSRLEAGMDHKYYNANPRIDAIAEKIEQLGGEQARVSLMPVTVTSDEFGAATFNVFKVEGTDGKTYFVEDVDPTRHYEGFDDWKSNSRLPPGQMTYVDGMEWGSANSCPVLKTEATPQVTDTFGEWAREIGDKVALGAGIVAGAALVIGTGGTGAIIVAGAAGAYTTARAGENLYDAHTHGVDITDLSNAEVRANWLDVAAGTLSFGAMGAAKFATLARETQAATGLSRGVAGLQLAANTADAAAATNQAHDLATNWDQMSNSERAMGLLNIAFWGGMTAAGTRASGAEMADAYSFNRLSNHMEFGAPYPVHQNANLSDGQMRVAYDVGADGRASNIRIEHGGATADANMLALHSRAARQMEASGGLLDRIQGHLNGRETAEVGSVAWEARHELNKIGAEARSISQELANPDLTPAERGRLELRLEELETATANEANRLTQVEAMGDGWVASPSSGAQQARELNWPEAPKGYVWVADSPHPHLRRESASESPKLYYDVATGKFTEDASTPQMQRVGHGDNQFEWKTNDQGQTVVATATLREYYTHAERSPEELAAQDQSRARGTEDDHAGHIIGHRFVLDQGLQNMFPQNGNFNTSAYKTLENELADWIDAGCTVEINVRLDQYQNGRPEKIGVYYQVTNPETGQVVYEKQTRFANEAGQNFERVDRSAMDEILAANG